MQQERLAQVVKGYELREQIGEGGYGVVHRAYQPLIGRDVAVKIILPQYANHPDFIRRFEWEAQLVARLEHPYIVPLYDYWRDPDGAFLVMRWLRGGNLHDLLHNRPLPTELLGKLIEQVGGALASAHRRGVVHRDLKPANILLDEEGNAYLADFGIAKDMVKRVSPYQTDASTVVGSPAYISPEQVRAEPITPQTDIYSLGVMLYEILTGQLPFHAPTPIALMFLHMNEPVPTVRTQRPDLSDAVNQVIQKATAKRPADRYADVTTLIQELRQALASGPVITGRLTDDRPTPSQTETGARSTRETSPRSKYETGVLYLPVPLPAPVETPVENPYKGLRAFQEADANDFFGRELLTQLLLTRMQEQVPLGRFLAVVGPSGSGKSSVVRAGVVPAIRRGGLPGSENWFVVEMFPSAHPIEELAQALMHVAVEPPNNLIGPLSLDDHGLLRVVDQVVPGADETEVVLVIDQFEELFTLVEDEALRTHFLDSLITAVTDPYSRVRVIVTLRADFYDRPLLYAGFSELMRARTEVVVPLAPEELKHAIINPAERNGLRVDPELVEAIIGDVAEQPGALPLLQYALTEVFERRSGRTLTLTPYHSSGGVLGALARRAEEIYSGLRVEQQEAARQLFLRLVTLGEGVEDTRRRVRRTELMTMTKDASNPGHTSLVAAPGLDLDAVIALYSQYRLLTLDNDPATRVPTIEVAHEALIRTWTRLRQWLDASRDDLRLQRRMTTAAAEWVASGHDGSFLASGARLEQLAGWAEETHLALNAEERAYLSASLAEREVQQAQEAARKAHEVRLERRSRSFLQALVGVALLAAVVGIGLSVYAFGQRREAQRNFTSAATAEAQAKQNAAQSDQNASRAEQNANTAATAQAQAVENAALAHDRALLAGADSEFYQDNPDSARSLALKALEVPNPLPDAENVFSRIAYAPGARWRFLAPGSVTAAAISPDDAIAVSASDDDTNAIIVWDLVTGEKRSEFEHVHKGPIRQIQFLPDGKRLLTTSEDTTVILWNVAKGTPIRTFRGHTGEVRGLAVRPHANQFLSGAGGPSNVLLLWDIDCATPSPTECDTPLRVFDQTKGGHSQELNQLTFTSDGARALTTGADGALVLWNVDTGEVLKHFEPEQESEVRAAVVLPGDRYVLTGGDGSGNLFLWDLDSPNPGTIVRVFTGHARGLYDVTISPDGQYALSGSSDNTMMLWDLTDKASVQRPLQVFHGHGLYIREVVFSNDGRHALSASKDKSLRYWDLASGAEQARWPSQDAINAGALSPDGQHMLTGGSISANLWDRTTGQMVKQFRWHGQAVKAVAFSADGQWVLSGGDKHDGAIFITDIKTGEIVRKFKFDTFGVNALAISPDRKYVVSGQVIPGAADYQDNAKLNPDLKNIGMILWDANTGEVIHTFPQLKGSANAVAFSADGTQVLATVGGDLTIWAIPSGDLIKTISGDKGKLNAVDLSADSTLVIAGGADKKAFVWNLATGERVFTSDLLSAEISEVAISRDGRYGAASAEGKIFVYDLTTKQLVRTLLGHNKFVRLLSFSADGRTLVSGGEDKTVRTWRLDTRPEMIAWAQANRYFPNLTCDQEELYSLPTIDCK